MKISDYPQYAIRTESIPEFNNSRIIHACFGLSTELLELYTADDTKNVCEELGDICWYLGILADNQELTFATVEVSALEEQSPFIHIAHSIGSIVDHVKRYIFYGQSLERIILQNELSATLRFVELIAEKNGYTLGGVLEKNIEKLKRRYPQGFNDLDAINNREGNFQ